jgi:hypothetical protein
MAAVALNTFKTVRHVVTDSNVGIYTAPIGVASIVLFAQAVNLDPENVRFVSLIHSRPINPDGGAIDFQIINQGPVIPNDALNLLNGRLVLETNDELRCLGNTTGDVKVVVSILETAKS